MKIAILCPSFGEYGGIGRIAEALAERFGAHGHPVAVIHRPGVRLGGRWETAPRLELAMPPLPRRGRQLRRQFDLALALTRALPRLATFLREHADVVLTLAISTYAPWSLLAARQRPVVVSLQGGEPSGRFAPHPGVFRHLLRRAAAVTACAESLVAAARRLAPEVGDRLTVVPNGVDVEIFAGPGPSPHPRPYLLAAGRFTRQKGCDVAIEAAARLEAVRASRVDLVFAGDGPDEAALRALAERRGIGSQVHFLGPIDRERMRAVYRGAAVVVVPSRWEGLPLVCLEAMASGRPVVASRVDGIPDAVVDGETGLLVPPDDADALARALARVLDDLAWAEGRPACRSGRSTCHPHTPCNPSTGSWWRACSLRRATRG